MSFSSLDNVKIDLGITDTSLDASLTRWITAAEASIAEYLGYPLELGYREHSTFIRLPKTEITVPFYPLKDVTKIVVDGETWLDQENSIEAGDGYHFETYGEIYAPYGCYFCGQVDIELSSGFDVSGSCRDLPYSIEMAVSWIVSGWKSKSERDPNVKAEAIPGVYSVQFDTTLTGSGNSIMGGVGQTLGEILEPFRIMGVAG